jgi:hypothetical protein
VPVIIDSFEIVEAPTEGDERLDRGPTDHMAAAAPVDRAVESVRAAARRAARLQAD